MPAHHSVRSACRRPPAVRPFILLVVCLLARQSRGETIDRVLAVVGGQLIMMSDVGAAQDLGLESAEGAEDPIRAVLSKLIDRELMVVEVDRYAPPEPAAEAVDRELAAVRARFPTPEAFDAVLARSGIAVTQLRQTLRENLRIEGYLEQRFTTTGRVTNGNQTRQALIEEWIAGLRRRSKIVDLYSP